MSAPTSQSPQPDEAALSGVEGFGGVEAITPGQNHERIGGDAVDVEITAGQKMVAALSGSFLTSVLVTPMDVVRVRIQSQGGGKPPQPTYTGSPGSFVKLPSNMGVTACCREVFWVNNYANYCAVGTPPQLNNLGSGLASPAGAIDCAAEETKRRTFTSTADAFRKIARNEGLSSLWRGLSPTLLMSVPGNVIYFTGYDWLRYDERSPLIGRTPEVYAPLIAGSIARTAAATAISPIEMFRTRLQASSTGGRLEKGGARSLFVDTLKGLRDMVQAQGVTSLWRGIVLTLWRDVPFSAIYWFGYETTRDSLTTTRDRMQGRQSFRDEPDTSVGRARSKSRSRESHAATFTDSFIAGAVSGAAAAIATMPFDVGKTRQQVFRHSGDSAAKSAETPVRALSPEERSMPRFLWHIFKEEGTVGLWRGCTARCMKVAPACAIMISSYEVGKKMARSMNRNAV